MLRALRDARFACCCENKKWSNFGAPDSETFVQKLVVLVIEESNESTHSRTDTQLSTEHLLHSNMILLLELNEQQLDEGDNLGFCRFRELQQIGFKMLTLPCPYQ